MSGTHSRDLRLDHISWAERFCTKIKSLSNSEESSSLKKKKHMTVTTEDVLWETDLGPKIKKQK